MTNDELYDTQLIFEQRYAKNNLNKRLYAEIDSESEIKNICNENNINYDFAREVIKTLMLHKRIDVVSIVGICRRFFDDIQAVVAELIKCIEHDICDYDTRTKKLVIRFDISDEIKEELARFQFPLPMLVHPKLVRCNSDCGYLDHKESLILRNNYHTDDINLDHINRINQIPLTVNLKTFYECKNHWKDIECRKQGETEEEYKARRKQFDDYNKQSKFVVELLNNFSDKFYLTHAYDKRGRIYCRGYHINYQGNDYAKAIVEFADKEYLE